PPHRSPLLGSPARPCGGARLPSPATRASRSSRGPATRRACTSLRPSPSPDPTTSRGSCGGGADAHQINATTSGSGFLLRLASLFALDGLHHDRRGRLG